jgi:hypothetical protein
MEYAISQLSYLPETREQQARFVEQAKSEILNGIFDARELLFRKKIIQDTLDQIFDDPQIKSHMLDEIGKYGKEGAAWGDAKITVESRKSYSYDNCGDTELAILSAESERATKGLKERQKFLQTLPKPVANPETGEMIYPAACTQTDFFKVSFTKK